MAIDWATATSDEMLAHLEGLDLKAFERASVNEAFTEEHVRLLLKKPGLDAGFVERISREPRFFQKNAVRVALALHPKLPRVRGLELLRYLYWRDLLRVAAQPGLHPQLRVTAEHQVSERVPDLTLGERIAVARSAGRTLLRALRTDPHPRVVDAVLHNYRCTEDDAAFIAASLDTPPVVLAVVARNPKWRARPSVRSQLVRNRRLGLPLALGLLAAVSPGEAAIIARQADLPKLLRDSAARMAREARRGAAGPGSGQT